MKKFLIIIILFLISITVYANNTISIGDVSYEYGTFSVLVSESDYITISFNYDNVISLTYDELNELTARLDELSSLIAISANTDVVYQKTLQSVRMLRGSIKLWPTFRATKGDDIIFVTIVREYAGNEEYSFRMTADDLASFKTAISKARPEHERIAREIQTFNE